MWLLLPHYENQIDSITNEILKKMIAEDSIASRATMSQQNLNQEYVVTTVKLEPMGRYWKAMHLLSQSKE